MLQPSPISFSSRLLSGFIILSIKKQKLLSVLQNKNRTSMLVIVHTTKITYLNNEALE